MTEQQIRGRMTRISDAQARALIDFHLTGLVRVSDARTLTGLERKGLLARSEAGALSITIEGAAWLEMNGTRYESELRYWWAYGVDADKVCTLVRCTVRQTAMDEKDRMKSSGATHVGVTLMEPINRRTMERHVTDSGWTLGRTRLRVD